MERAAEMALRPDLVVALGSTLGVYPAASPGWSRPPGGPRAPRARPATEPRTRSTKARRPGWKPDRGPSARPRSPADLCQNQPPGQTGLNFAENLTR